MLVCMDAFMDGWCVCMHACMDGGYGCMDGKTLDVSMYVCMFRWVDGMCDWMDVSVSSVVFWGAAVCMHACIDKWSAKSSPL